MRSHLFDTLIPKLVCGQATNDCHSAGCQAEKLVLLTIDEVSFGQKVVTEVGVD